MDSLYQSERLTALRSSSRSPSRRKIFADHALSDLSPTTTLEALRTTDSVPISNANQLSFVQATVASASTSERAWGFKAALAAKNIGEWHTELAEWSWPTAPAKHSNGFEGCLLGSVAQAYEDRIQVIKEELGSLEVEVLMDYIRDSHSKTRSNRSSIYDVHASSTPIVQYDHLDDFTAIITTTIVQALPNLSLLTALLSTWSTRLLILRQTDPFLRDLSNSQESILSAWITIGKHEASTTKRKPHFTRQVFAEVQAVLRDQISELGRRLDGMLDLLEGSVDTLPEHWIEAMDSLENDYSDWVVTAQELVLTNEMGVNGKGEKSAANQSKPFKDLQHAVNGDLTTPEDGIELNGTREGGMAIDASQGSLLRSGDAPLPSAPCIETDLNATPKDKDVSRSPNSHIGSPKATPKSNFKPAPLALDFATGNESTASSQMVSDASAPGSAISGYYSDRSSPEIRNASVIAYPGSSLRIKSLDWSSKEPETPSKSHRRRSMGFFGDSDTRDSGSDINSGFTSEGNLPLGYVNSHTRARSASVKSFEVIPRSEVRRILVRRSGSYSSVSAIPSSVEIENKALPAIQDIPPFRPKSKTSRSSEDRLHASISERDHDGSETKPTAELGMEINGREDDDPNLVTPLSLPKTRHKLEQVPGLSSESILTQPQQLQSAVSSGKHSLKPNAQSQTPDRPPAGDFGDQFEARISSILTKIPAHIRLTSGPEADAPEVARFNTNPSLKTPIPRSSAPRLTRARTSVPLPTMTLAPAQPKNSKSRFQNGEPEIKLYHLYQSGREAPIKLFVRLVGESGERVMVRIGGGWADLGEYLKEYASHHGGRSVSDGAFTVQGFPPPSSTSHQTSSPSSRPVSPTPSSSRQSPAISLQRQHTSPAIIEPPHTPASDPSTTSSSRMSAYADEDSPSLGLAGPKAKKADISPRKQAWVDGLLVLAKRSGLDNKSSGKSSNSSNSSPLGDLGTVGGTKRVFMKGKKGD